MSTIQLSDQEVLELNVITALKLESLPEDQKVQLLNNMATLVQKRAMVKIIDMLSEDDKTALNTLIEEKGEESPEIADFFRTHIEDVEGLFRTELIALKRELVDEAARLEAAVEAPE